ncbi:efflux RND transporter periplasmic adaptor subunit [Guyparkeria hydrothermalis]|uniref:efflux RND transporter periplasmic adaptor subunit n=1 Tax=Guyparkeria hydrothermalis TaxID=923 RepID=UPI00202000B2|nr:efflux RND transporter periplasmic adaptor subunit [Guyparkeria hydrothermalis]MCL7743787.1 efflux RND transporter periplasmic adaptor subunit [Guyparkeria hydrothermalis]
MNHATHSFLTSASARRLAGSLLVALASLGLAGCGGDEGEKHAAAGAETTIQGDWITVDASKVDDTALFPGTVMASDRSPIASRMMGYVREINVREGETVDKDQVLLTIDQSDVTSQIRQAEAALAKARSGLANARSNYERFKRLYEENAVPKQQFEQMRTAYEVAQGDYRAAQAAVEQAESQVSYAQIRAPFAGTIVQRMADPGQLATPGQPLLMLMGSGDREIQVEVDDQAFAKLDEGDRIEVGYRSTDGTAASFDGEVLRLVGAADPITRTHTVKISVPADVPLSPGNYVTVNVVLDQKPAITVPASALHDRAGMQGVFVLDDDDRARFRLVRIGQQRGDEVVVLAGLRDGDRVVVRAADHLSNGVKVTRNANSKGGADS